jgi:hypothetical protein
MHENVIIAVTKSIKTFASGVKCSPSFFMEKSKVFPFTLQIFAIVLLAFFSFLFHILYLLLENENVGEKCTILKREFKEFNIFANYIFINRMRMSETLVSSLFCLLSQAMSRCGSEAFGEEKKKKKIAKQAIQKHTKLTKLKL